MQIFLATAHVKNVEKGVVFLAGLVWYKVIFFLNFAVQVRM